MKVIFAGGGSGGPVAPLLAIYEKLKERDSAVQAVWLGTKKGPEKKMVESYAIDFKTISSGKLRRYFSFLNLIDPFKILAGYFQAKSILKQFQPDVVLTAGGFIAVPVVWAAASLKIPSFIHQQDLEKGLANKLMEKKATAITVTFEDSLKDYPQDKTYLTSNPVRQQVFFGSKEKAVNLFKLEKNLPVIFISGGGQGAESINQAVLESLPQLTERYQLVHQTGTGKSLKEKIKDLYKGETLKLIEKRYRGYEFMQKEIFDAYAVADLIVSRSGLGTLTELAVLNKPAILIPLPGHQEKNAEYFAQNKAVRVLPQPALDSESLIKIINDLLKNSADLQQLSKHISAMIDKEAASKYVDLIYKILKQ